MPGEQMTLHEVAALMGVHYMTVYRYVRLGRLHATKVGATWQVHPDDVAAFRAGRARSGGRAAGSLPASASASASGVGGPGATTRRRAAWAARFEARALAGDGAGAWSVVEACLVAGYDPTEVCMEVLVPTLHRVGERWEAGEVDVAAEHRASVIVRQALGRLSPRFRRRGRGRGTVVVGSAPGERHDMAVTVVADLLCDAGFDGVDLGADVPAPAFAAAASRADHLVAVAISATMSADPALAAAVEAVRAAAPEAVVLVGGQGVSGLEHARALGAGGYAADARGAVLELEALLER